MVLRLQILFSWFCAVCSWVEYVAKTRKAMTKLTKSLAEASSPTIAITHSWYYLMTNSLFCCKNVLNISQLVYVNHVIGILFKGQSPNSKTRVLLLWNFDNDTKSLVISFLLWRVSIVCLLTHCVTVNYLIPRGISSIFLTGFNPMLDLHRQCSHQLHGWAR